MAGRPLGIWILLALLGAAATGRAQGLPSAEAGTGDGQDGREEARARLVVVLEGLRNRSGVVRLALYGGEAGFPSDHARAVRGATEEIGGPEVRVVFEGLAPGTYALSVFHDEDGDGKLKRGIFGIPTEGIAFSRDARNPVGPPKWKDAKFELPPGQTTITCHLRY